MFLKDRYRITRLQKLRFRMDGANVIVSERTVSLNSLSRRFTFHHPIQRRSQLALLFLLSRVGDT